jgi:hypothetical protein
MTFLPRPSGQRDGEGVVCSGRMRRRSTLWFLLAAAWGVLLALNLLRHRGRNTLVIAIVVAAFLLIGVLYRRRETKTRKPTIK